MKYVNAMVNGHARASNIYKEKKALPANANDLGALSNNIKTTVQLLLSCHIDL